jgi:hypothetical protein
LDVLLKGLDTVVAQAVAEAGANAVSSRHRSGATFQASEVPICRQVFALNNVKMTNTHQLPAPNSALVFMLNLRCKSNGLAQATEEEVAALAVKLNVFHTMNFLMQSLG